jgi:hypothetical protein
MRPLPESSHNPQRGGGTAEFGALEVLADELSAALSLYWSTAARLLAGSGIKILDPTPESFSLENNFFSALFLYSYRKAKIAKPRRILYAAVNQCLRGMVTGCDNILDDEYNKTLETDLPPQARRFRSILDIMVSDRVLVEILLSNCQPGSLDYGRVLAASAASLRALTRSGVQEAAEEGGVGTPIEPEEVLRSVHHYKTGILFQAPWVVPAVLEHLEEQTVLPITQALYQIGLGCQILDDMVDLPNDVAARRHNYVASLIYHNPDPQQWAHLETRLAGGLTAEAKTGLLFEFSRARLAAARKALTLLEAGASALFGEEHRLLVEPTIVFLAKRIQAARFLSDQEL